MMTRDEGTMPSLRAKKNSLGSRLHTLENLSNTDGDEPPVPKTSVAKVLTDVYPTI
jgi:hypothetical protein